MALKLQRSAPVMLSMHIEVHELNTQVRVFYVAVLLF